jgi:hypothetical protein
MHPGGPRAVTDGGVQRRRAGIVGQSPGRPALTTPGGAADRAARFPGDRDRPPVNNGEDETRRLEPHKCSCGQRNGHESGNAAGTAADHLTERSAHSETIPHITNREATTLPSQLPTNEMRWAHRSLNTDDTHTPVQRPIPGESRQGGVVGCNREATNAGWPTA